MKCQLCFTKDSDTIIHIDEGTEYEVKYETCNECYVIFMDKYFKLKRIKRGGLSE